MVKTNAIRIQVQKALTWPRLRSTRLKDVGQGGQRFLRVDNSAPDLSQLAVRELRNGSVVSVRGAPIFRPHKRACRVCGRQGGSPEASPPGQLPDVKMNG